MSMSIMDLLNYFGIQYNELHRIVVVSVASATVLVTIAALMKIMKKNKTNKSVKDESTPLVIVTGCDTGLGYSVVMRYLNGGHCNENQNYFWSMFSHNKLKIPKNIAIVAFVLNPYDIGAMQLLVQSKNSNIELFVEKLDLNYSESINKAVTFINNLLELQSEGTGQFKYKIQALVNNAGRMVMGDVEWQSPQMIRNQFEVNILGPITFTAQLLPLFRRDKSRIINIVSHCGFMPLPGISVYGATKAAMNAWTMGSRVELENHGIRMITFSPGSFAIYSAILSKERRAFNYNKMREHLSEEQLAYYSDHIKSCEHFLNSVDGYITTPDTTAIIPIGNTIYSYMDNAIWEYEPKHQYYVPDPLRYKFYFAVTSILSIFGLHYLKDKALRRFVCIPSFKSHASYLKKYVK